MCEATSADAALHLSSRAALETAGGRGSLPVHVETRPITSISPTRSTTEPTAAATSACPSARPTRRGRLGGDRRRHDSTHRQRPAPVAARQGRPGARSGVVPQGRRRPRDDGADAFSAGCAPAASRSNASSRSLPQPPPSSSASIRRRARSPSAPMPTSSSSTRRCARTIDRATMRPALRLRRREVTGWPRRQCAARRLHRRCRRQSRIRPLVAPQPDQGLTGVDAELPWEHVASGAGRCRRR